MSTPSRIMKIIYADNMSRDLQLLAISSRMTELSYNISDIQTRIFGT